MRVLIVSNLYPPYFKGGYEVRCAQLAVALQARGHDVVVLTSTYGLPDGGSSGRRASRAIDEVDGIAVHRILFQHAYGPPVRARPWTVFQARREVSDARHFMKLVEGWRPEVINWWSMNGLSKSLLSIPPRLGIPDIHWIEHPWMIWEYGRDGDVYLDLWRRLWAAEWLPKPVRPLARPILTGWESRLRREGIETRRLRNEPSLICFVSEYMRRIHLEAGIDCENSVVIHGGVPVERFYRPRPDPGLPRNEPLRLLYAGQITRDRGLHTIIGALKRLPAAARENVRLSIVGGTSPAYGAYVEGIREELSEAELMDRVRFLGFRPHEEMSQIFAEHDVLVFASNRPEGFPLTMVEAMLAGCAVVTTEAGGAEEVAALADLPTFTPGEEGELARLLERLLENRDEMVRLARRGQEIARTELSVDRMADRFEEALAMAIGAGGAT